MVAPHGKLDKQTKVMDINNGVQKFLTSKAKHSNNNSDRHPQTKFKYSVIEEKS